jgi:cyanophycinase-like exopeptidase
MWKAVKQVVIGLLSSKKAVMGISAAIAAGTMKLGFGVSSETVALIVGPVVAAIIGQGVADHGKEAAKVTASADVQSVP